MQRLLWSEALQFDLQTTDPEDSTRKVCPQWCSQRRRIVEVETAQYSIFQLLAIGDGAPEHFCQETTVREKLRANKRTGVTISLIVRTFSDKESKKVANAFSPTLPLLRYNDSVQSGKSKEPGICKLDLRLQAGYGIHPIDLSVGMFELWSSDMLKSAKDIEVVNDSKPCPSETVLVNPNYSSFIWAPSL
ncbi:hypothetical protein AXG93_725s1370 [Marchantia polymorpha subsp. ruderalis]|uniref:Uncharacterized protein n=1 Tax=Marchantia polymorpha subsp. ruderalis TaxID=1480154 RepID=A0A176WE97_MARPO|nr:hypothetical protein AXG93_725s1370 [Marchantia polymorpha subsp. ruderalis]